MEDLISNIFLIIGIYLVLGVLFSIVFLWKGVDKVDPGAKGSGWFFKVLLFPGLVFLWVIFLKKWLKTKNS